MLQEQCKEDRADPDTLDEESPFPPQYILVVVIHISNQTKNEKANVIMTSTLVGELESFLLANTCKHYNVGS